MTTETSNARGEVVAWIRVKPDGSPDWAEDCIADDEHFLNPAMEADGYRLRPLIYADTAPPPAAARVDVPYDRVLIARMLGEAVPYLREYYRPDSMREQARLLREADNAAVANVGTVAARGDVRGLVAKLAAHVRPTCSELWDEAQAFLAAEGVQAGDVEQRARELLAAEYQKRGHGRESAEARASYIERHECAAFDAIARALSQQPEARFQGVGATQAAHELNTRLTEDRAILNDIRDAMGGGPYDTLAARIRKQQPEARGVVGELVQMGDDEDGHPRLIINTTREAIKASNLVPFSQVEVRNG